MSGRDAFTKDLWTPRSVEDTLKVYADWAPGYEADVTAHGYATPGRVARAMAGAADPSAPVMDFGCGTGLSGMALAEAGFTKIDGTDVSPEMLEEARAKPCYRGLLQGIAGEVPDLSSYGAVAATGVVSLGAAPADLLAPLLSAMAPGAILGLSYNIATLGMAEYLRALADVQAEGLALMLMAEHGPHLPGKAGAETSTVYLLRRQ